MCIVPQLDSVREDQKILLFLVLFLCRVHLTSGIPTPNTLSASGLTVYAIASDMVYQQQVNSSSWGHQLGNNSQVLYICNRVAYHDLLNATKENGNLTIFTDETATVMSESIYSE